MPSFAGLSKFFGRTVSEGAAFAAGVAVAPTLEPVVQELKNEAWSKYQTRPLEPGDLAEIVAEDVEIRPWGEGEATKSGLSPGNFDALVGATLNAPGVGELLVMWRRGAITDAQFVHGLRKARFEGLWDSGVRALKDEYLPPAVVALGIVRNTVPDPGLQVGAHDTSGSDIPQGDQYPGDVLAEFEAGGVNAARARVMVQNIGLPMPPVRAASAFFRGIINKASYYLSVAQSDSRPAWADAILEEARQITTAHDAIENAIRGYSDMPTMLQRTARHGMSADDSMILFQNAGRPLVAHQITTGLARGGVFEPEPGEMTDPYDAAVRESNVKPSYYDLWKANRYTYPSLFQLNQLVKADAITADTAKDWAVKDGYAPEVVDVLHTFWQGEQSKQAGASGTKPKSYTYAQIHAAWRNGVFDDATALSELQGIGYSAAKAQTLLNVWKSTPAPGSGGIGPA